MGSSGSSVFPSRGQNCVASGYSPLHCGQRFIDARSVGVESADILPRRDAAIGIEASHGSTRILVDSRGFDIGPRKSVTTRVDPWPPYGLIAYATRTSRGPPAATVTGTRKRSCLT